MHHIFLTRYPGHVGIGQGWQAPIPPSAHMIRKGTSGYSKCCSRAAFEFLVACITCRSRASASRGTLAVAW